VKIYLLSMDGGRCVFYSEGPEAVAEIEGAEPRRGMRGWAERKYKSLQAVLNESEKGVGLRVRRAWEWLQKRIPPDEPLLRSLRGARDIMLHHPVSFTEGEAGATWKKYLKSRQGRHTFWFVINALVSPLTVLLAPLPGPNLIGYWFVYRAVCHWLARLGARNARSEQVTTTFLSTGALDGSFTASDDERIASLSSSFGLQGLDAFVKRVAASRRGMRRKTPLIVNAE
jgi:Mitochondrial K+-H+ exchange-related